MSEPQGARVDVAALRKLAMTRGAFISADGLPSVIFAGWHEVDALLDVAETARDYFNDRDGVTVYLSSWERIAGAEVRRSNLVAALDRLDFGDEVRRV